MSFMLLHLVFLYYVSEMAEACAVYGVDKKCIQSFVVKPERKRPLGRHVSIWEGNFNLLKPSGNFTYHQV
jgi:hypothetical protein